MTRRSLAGALCCGLLVSAWPVGCGPGEGAGEALADGVPGGSHPALLHGRVITDDGDVFEGRLRWGGDEEALWGNYFNGVKDENPWAVYVPEDVRPRERASVGIFGVEIAWERPADLGRPFMVRFGDISRIEPRGRGIRVALKSGTTVDLDRFAADDVADGLRVWDAEGRVVDLGEWGIRSIELLAAGEGTDPDAFPLQGTVHTTQGDFTGLLQWDRESALESDVLEGRRDGALVRVPFGRVRTVARDSDGAAIVTLRDGSEVVLSGTRATGDGHRGVYVDDARYGRVLVSWDALERVDFGGDARVPGYDDFPPTHRLEGAVTTRSGRRLEGRLVYDLDESDTAETLDAPWRGVDYTIPFGLVASIEVGSTERGDHARVTLRSGEALTLEAVGDLGDANAGMLVFVDGRPGAEYVPWSDVERIELGDALARGS